MSNIKKKLTETALAFHITILLNCLPLQNLLLLFGSLVTFFHLSLVVRKPAFRICENKDADQLHGYRELISIFVFATRIVQSLFFQNPKFEASIHLLWQYSPIFGAPGRKLQRPVSSQKRLIYCLTTGIRTSNLPRSFFWGCWVLLETIIV